MVSTTFYVYISSRCSWSWRRVIKITNFRQGLGWLEFLRARLNRLLKFFNGTHHHGFCILNTQWMKGVKGYGTYNRVMEGEEL